MKRFALVLLALVFALGFAGTAEAAVSKKTAMMAQDRLAELGLYNGDIDGKVGPQTRAAIKEFQEMAGIPRTGKLDRRTIAQLKNSDGPSMRATIEPPPSPGAGNPIAYFSDPWQTKPKYVYPGGVILENR